MIRVGYIQQAGIDMVPHGEQGYHTLLDEREDEEAGNLFACLCHPLMSVELEDEYVPIIWHREIT